jgi:PAS domain-containing protein
MESDRRLRAALLPYQPRLLHDVLDGLDVAVVVLDETGRVLAGNVAATRLLGVQRGRRAADVPEYPVELHDEQGGELDALDFAYWHAVAARGDTVMVRVGHGEGERWLSVTAQRLGRTDPAGTDPDEDAIVCRYTDVTLRRELERRAAAAADLAARAEIDLVAAEQRVALLEDLLVYVATRQAAPRG